jgi:hypothetical protein
MSSERVDRFRKISDEAIAHDQALVAALRERAEVAETDKEIAVEDNIRLMNENEHLQADLASARQAINVLNERQRVEWARAETAEARAEGLERALREQAELWALAKPDLQRIDGAEHRVPFVALHQPLEKIAAALGPTTCSSQLAPDECNEPTCPVHGRP